MTPKEYILDTGEAIKYDNLHSRLRRTHGKAKECKHCQGEKSTNYEWALVKGREYSLNIEDYIPLCASCHRHYDRCYGNIGDIVRGKPAHNIVSIIDSDGGEYSSITEASNKTGILRTSIHNCLMGRSKTAGGKKWIRK